MRKRKICFVITNYIHYSRNLLILDELNRRDDVELSIVVGGSALITKYSASSGSVLTQLKEDGFKHIYEIYFSLEGDNTTVKAKTAGLGIVEYATLFNNIKPDMVVVRGDRFEVLSAALTAAYMNIPVGHIEGGDVSGTLDESVRHAITKLAHVHFVTNEDAYKRLVRMGENPKSVHYFGSPDVEVASVLGKKPLDIAGMGKTGSGSAFDPKDGYLMVMYHSVWGDAGQKKLVAQNTKALLQTIHELHRPTLWFWPNIDVGSEDISHELRRFNDSTKEHRIRFMRYLPPRLFLPLLNNADCLIGNSSSGLKECSYLGVPVVNVGSRQGGRLRAPNVVDVEYEKEKLSRAIVKQAAVKKYPTANVYYKKNTASNIAKVLATTPLNVQKRFHE